mgnify:CR=1 FL=1
MIKQLAHICIYSNDLNETKRFYLNALEMEIGFEFIKDDQLFGFYLKCGNNTFIEVFKGSPGAVGNINHLALEVDDIDLVLKKTQSAGYPIGTKKMGADHSWQAWLEDPSGVRIELHEYTDQSLQRTGGSCIVNW